MGERNSVYVFKGLADDEFRTAFGSTVSELGGRLEWEEHPDHVDALLWTSHKDDVHAAYIRWQEYEIAKRIGTRLEIPWMNVRIQEGSLWDYSLYLGETHLHNFSTLPEYWETDDPDWVATQRGDATQLANIWGIEQASVQNYLEPWGHWNHCQDDFVYTQSGKAYDHDRHAYRDIWQMTDFLRALGAHDPNWDQPTSIARLLEPSPGGRR